MSNLHSALILAIAVLTGVPVPAGAQEASRPTILSVTMSATGEELFITGTGFGPAPEVTIDGQPVTVLPGRATRSWWC